MTYRLLLVDDEPLTLEYLSCAIPAASDSWTVAGAVQNGDDALAFLGETPVHLVITDIKMPGMNGLKLAQILKRRDPLQEIVILSGYDEFPLAQQALKIGVSEYLLKPIKKKELSEVLEKIERRIRDLVRQKEQRQMLEQLTDTYQKPLMADYLKAAFRNSGQEMEFYGEMISRVLPDFQTVSGSILIVKVDEDCLYELSSRELALVSPMLQRAADSVSRTFPGCFLLTESENELVFCLLKGRTAALCAPPLGIFHEISSRLRQKLPLTASAGLGDPADPARCLSRSCRQARERLSGWLFHGGQRLFSKAPDPGAKKLMEQIGEIASLTTAPPKGDPAVPSPDSLMGDLIRTLPDSPEIIFRCLILFCSELCKKDAGRFRTPCLLLLQLIRPLLSKPAPLMKSESLHQMRRLLFAPRQVQECVSESASLLVQNAVSYIHEHFSESIALSQIADALKVSPNYLSRQFHEQTGESYIKFLTRIRMEYAAELLKKYPDAKISAVAEQSGYFNLKHFNYAFREFYHTTPGNFQKSFLPKE